MIHVLIKPLTERPCCVVCCKRLKPHMRSEFGELTMEQYVRYKGRKKTVLRADCAKLNCAWLREEGKPVGYFAVHDGTYGVFGDNYFHANSCAIRYARDAVHTLVRY